ncbi:MAG TPA: response regulator [Stellaceae bacterium]|jgi:two-component system chemotaxis sensor kinase CheA|nr:response regulator [Stellaceae bacterium]
MAEDPYRYFRLEAREILDQFGSTVLQLERTGQAGQVQQLLRLAHTLKGAARVVKQPEIADCAHAIEDALSPFRETGDGVPHGSIDAVLRSIDTIGLHVRALDAPARPAAAATQQPAPPSGSAAAIDEPIRTVRADIAEMDLLLEGIGETHALLSGLHGTLRTVEQAQHLADLVAAQLAPRGTAEPLRQSTAAAGGIFPLADDLRRNISAIERRLTATVEQLERELGQVRDAAEQLRLVGAGTLFTLLERTARDSAQALAKEIAFTTKGGDIRLDADILGSLQAALVQIVRNAVAHGIEPAKLRLAAGKPAAGRIAVDVSRRGDRIAFACHDDGGGLDLDAVRQAALRRGLSAEAANRLSAQDLINLLLRGGISTSASVTEIAGRGIGLDLVRETIERLGGTVEITTKLGQGTTFELAVPLSLVSMEALIVQAGEMVATVPLDAVRATMLLGAEAVARDALGATILHEEQAIPFLWLPQLIGGDRPPSGRKWPTIIVAAATGTAAIGVEGLLGIARAVMQQLPDLANAGPIVAGASFDAEGNPRLMLSPEGLLTEARRQNGAAPEAKSARYPVLVVDDSLTTRMLEQSILESAGYEVDTAVSAEEALEVARSKRYALFLVDVEMPGMDGFTFVERTRADPALHDIPAVMVTSRVTPEDLQRGRDVGARGHIAKGAFDQRELLALIRPLIG